ncbi:MAG: thiamine-monophosphate kinase [Actinomycetota bacterium]|jgi:thiamine-monophosphate kinase|nr:thiamine-monophosphate kinase [Actinomycetota bacterium]
MAGEPGTVGELGEFDLIRAITARLPSGPDVVIGAGDDAAVVRANDGSVVASTDLLVEGRHFRRDWSEAYDVGRKAAAQSLADIAAMGAVPTALLVGLAAPPALPVPWVLSLADGLRDECQPVGASVAGGDVVRSDSLCIAVTAFGSLEGRAPVTRAGAQVGDVVAVAGRLGWAAAGYAILSRGFRSPRVLVEAHRRPSPPYAKGPQAATLGATAMIDVSDGLVQDLGHVAEASGVLIDLASGVFEVPEVFQDTARALSADPMTWVLGGGEDHALAACFPPETELPDGWLVVGRVREQGAAGGAVVLVDGEPYDGPAGWQTFS